MLENQDLQKVSQFFAAYAEMRKFQRLYFKNRMIPDLQEAKKWEKEADRLHTELTAVDKSAGVVQHALYPASGAGRMNAQNSVYLKLSERKFTPVHAMYKR